MPTTRPYSWPFAAHGRNASSCRTAILRGLARGDRPLPTLESEQDVVYPVPESRPVALLYRGLPLDKIEDLLVRSPAYRQAGRLLLRLSRGRSGGR